MTPMCDSSVRVHVILNTADEKCECNDCFMVDPKNGTCFFCSDYLYNTTSRTCGTDFRQDQRRAFVLSLFLSSTGAANFYIQSYGLGEWIKNSAATHETI